MGVQVGPEYAVREKSQAARTARSQKSQWNLDKLLKAIKENCNEEYSKAANDIYDWSSRLMDRIWWSDAKIDGSFIPVSDGQLDQHWFFAVRSTGKIELYLGAMSKKPPFDSLNLREEFIQRLNKLGANMPIEKSSHYPKFSLGVILSPEKIKAFRETIEWALEKAQQSNEAVNIEE